MIWRALAIATLLAAAACAPAPPPPECAAPDGKTPTDGGIGGTGQGEDGCPQE